MKDIVQFYKTENLEKIGKYLFKKAMSDLKANRFNAAYDNIIIGYNYVTCDCANGDWFNNDEVVDILSTSSFFDCLAYKLDFLKAFIYNYTKKYGAALNSINSFIDLQPSHEIGYYFKGKILLGLEKYIEAIENFEKALRIKKTSRTLYRIGRTKEAELQIFGLHEMYEAIVMNPSCGDAHWHFASHAMMRGLFPDELKHYFNSFHENITVCGLRLGMSIEKEFAKNGKIGINNYLISLEQIMVQISENENKVDAVNEIDNYDFDSDYNDNYESIYEKIRKIFKRLGKYILRM